MPDAPTDASRRHLRLVVGPAVALAAALLPLRAPAQEPSPPPAASRGAGFESGFVELDAEAKEAIEQGVAWLAREQTGSGRWGCNPVNYQMSVTALAGLALLAHGDTPETGRYARHVRRAVEWTLDSQKKGEPWPGVFFDRDVADEDDRVMHGHGFALLFLAEAYGQTSDPGLRERMHRAIAAGVRLTERSVSPEGGWYYKPFEGRDEGSVTVTQIQALRSARNAGVAVDARTIERAVDYIKRSQQPDGGVRYTLTWGKTSPALTAAGMEVLFGAGVYGGEAIDKGFAYLRRRLSVDPDDRENNQFFFYTQLYAAQAMFQRGGPEWAGYFPRIRRQLLDLRRGQPSWDSDFGRAYGTASALLVLELPLRYLPIFQR